jgi:prefoldin subunit 5
MSPLAVIQAVQTIGIFVLAGVVIYMVARLERAVEKGAKRIQTVLKRQQEFEARLDRIEKAHASLAQQIETMEKRGGAS